MKKKERKSWRKNVPKKVLEELDKERKSPEKKIAKERRIKSHEHRRKRRKLMLENTDENY